MVHVEFDTSPISVQHGYQGNLWRTEVYLYDELIWASKYAKWLSTLDEDEVKETWDSYFQQFQAEQFKEWLKTNGPGTQAKE